ncbi:hypothetical protein [Bacillus sp. Marseille-Q3570]|uniref:hypothetical protein n=1 Tax=Bacillus sp. Marseille-Q3570 TaxID=2963522 RepID=UPI0021B6F3C2|nr:hypothetical protein [Bacillus sp. Marseille-Q3570]
METNELYFSDNFFSAGMTQIFNSNKEEVGKLDLKSAFSSKMDVLNAAGEVIIRGGFRFFSAKWSVTDKEDNEIGLLRQRFAFFAKRYEYEVYDRGVYRIESESFSKEYRVLDGDDTVVAHFEKISGFFESPAYKLENNSDVLSNEELIAVVMGITMIMKQNASATSATT